MNEFNKAIENNQEHIQKSLGSTPPHVRASILQSLSKVYETYTSNLEELIEACTENRLVMLNVPKELQSLNNIDYVEELMIDLLYDAIKIKSETSTNTDNIEPVYEKAIDGVVDIPLENLIFQAMEDGTLPSVTSDDSIVDSNLNETIEVNNTEERKPPVILQEPAISTGAFSSESVDVILKDTTKNTSITNNITVQPKSDIPTNTDILDIKLLKVNEKIVKYAICASCETASSPKSTWLELILKDIDGKTIVARLFGYSQEYKGFKGKIIKLEGSVNSFNNTLTIKLDNVTDEDIPYKLDSFVKSIPNVKEYIKILQELLKMIEDNSIKNMMIHIFKNESMLQHYATRASAVSQHGVLKGDLLKHTVNVTRSALYAAKINEVIVDKDVIISAGLLHDLGKVIELPPVGLTEYTLEGKLLRHTFISANYVYNKCKEFNVPSNKMLNIIHCILSHHGKLEYGAPVLPATIEASLISDSDNQDAHTVHIQELLVNTNMYESARDSHRTEYIKL